MLGPGFVLSLNHLLRDAEWARERLRAHAGQVACIGIGPLRLSFKVESSGLLTLARDDCDPDLLIELPVDALARGLDGRDALSRAATMRGNVEFAEAVGFVLRNLRWDVEEDLSRVTGDLAARRIALTGAALARALSDGGRRLAENLSDYLRHEAAVAVPRDAVGEFCRAVDDLRDDAERIEARLRRLETARDRQ